MLQFTASQQLNTLPFTFKTTGIRVYSFEEVLYHVYHYWRESVDDFLSDGMIAWVTEIGHSYLAARMKEISKKEPFTQRILDFLKLIEYFSQKEINTLKSNLEAWEMRREWEKLKERADFLVHRGEPNKALPLYKRALQYEENANLLNNMGVVYMQLSEPKDALRQLTRALTLDPKNVSIMMHYIESAILNENYDSAAKILAKAKELKPDCADIPFLSGLMAYSQKNFTEALDFMDEAIKLDPSVPYYVYKTVDIHMAIRQYDKATQILEQVENKDVLYYTKEAELHERAGDIPAAIRAMTQAAQSTVTADSTANANLWARLAGYHRQNYDMEQAEEAIKKAITIAPHNDLVQLENARIKKGLGRTREYQAALNDVLKGFKDKYRAEA